MSSLFLSSIYSTWYIFQSPNVYIFFYSELNKISSLETVKSGADAEGQFRENDEGARRHAIRVGGARQTEARHRR